MDNKTQNNKAQKPLGRSYNNNLLKQTTEEKAYFLSKQSKEKESDRYNSQDKPNNNIYISDNNNSNSNVFANNTFSNLSKEDAKAKLTRVFNYFSKYSSKENDYFLNQQGLIKILKLTKIIDEKTFKTSDVDLILKKILSHSTKISLKSFLDFFVYTSRKLEPENFEMNQKETFKNFIINVFDPILMKIDNNFVCNMEDYSSSNYSMLQQSTLLPNHNSIDNILKSFEFDYKIKAIINNISYSLKEVYIVYFIYEVKNKLEKQRLIEGSFQNLIQFTKEFEINPYLCNMNQIVLIWEYLLPLKEIEVKQNMKGQHSFLLVEKDLGQQFKFSKFVAFIVYLSIISFNKYYPQSNISQISNQEKLVLFLEKLDGSKGFQNLERKTSKPHTSKITLIPDKDVIELINPKLNSTVSGYFDDENNEEKSFNTTNLKKIREYNSRALRIEEFDLKDLLMVNESILNKIESLSDLLNDIFLYYSKFGDKLSNARLTLNSFTKFLKDCDVINNGNISNRDNPSGNNHSIISQLKNSTSSKKFSNNNNNQQELKLTLKDVAVMFYSLTGVKNFDFSEKIRSQFDKNKGILKEIESSNSGPKIDRNLNILSTHNIPFKMDLNLFIKSFEMIALKLYPDKNLDAAVNIFLEKDIKRLLSNIEIVTDKSVFTNIYNSLQREDINDLLSELQPIIYPHYENYANPNKLICFDQFFEFYKDFSIFPDLINLIKLKNLFFTLSDHFSFQLKLQTKQLDKTNNENENETKIMKKVTNVKCINYDLFLDSLTITANIVRTNEDYTEIEKILYLVERMNQSSGINKSQKRKGNTFCSFKDFSNFFNFLKDKYPDFYQKKLMNNTSKGNFLSFNGMFD